MRTEKVLAEDDSVEGVEPQDKQDWACYLAPFILTLLVLLGAVYRTMNNPRLGCMPWCKQGSTLIRGTDMFLLAVWERAVDTTTVRTAKEKRVVDTTMVHTSANEKRDVNTRMVCTSNEKRVIVGTKSGTDQDYHGRILKTHSRSEYNSTSEELVDENREGVGRR